MRKEFINMVRQELKDGFNCNLIYLSKSGSHLYKLNTPESDEDYVGVFIPDIAYYFGNKDIKIINSLSVKDKDKNGKNTAEAIDITLYSVNEFIKLLSKCNPNIIELLYANEEDILYIHETFQKVIDKRDMFLNKTYIDNAFYNYAISQKRKMFNKKINHKVLSFLKECLEKSDEDNLYNLFTPLSVSDTIIFDNKKYVVRYHYVIENSGDRFDVTIDDGKEITELIKFSANDTIKTAIQKIENRIKMYGYRVNDDKTYDKKFASHTVRLLDEAIQLFETGKIMFPLQQHKAIMEIKIGEMLSKDVEEVIDNMIIKFKYVKEHTELPNKTNSNLIDKFLIGLVYDYFKENKII